MTDVLVVRTGIANLASVRAGLTRAGATPVLTDDAAAVAEAGAVMLPGVGAFGAAMAVLRGPLGDALVGRIRAGRPTLSICLGLQLLAATSEESPGVTGLGVVPGQVTRFAEGLRVPHMGWNAVTPTPGARLLTPGHAYFANSFHLDHLPEGWEGAHTEHGGPFVSALERGPVLACQFHPELSGDWGQDLLGRWLQEARAC